MKIIYTKSYEKTLKKLKKHHQELENLKEIIISLESISDFNKLLSNNMILTKYNFERLKYDNNNFYSFNLSKNGGTIRLIAEPLEPDIILVYISLDHYKDFSKEKVIYYE